MFNTTTSGAAGFGRVDMSGLARRQLRMSLGLVGMLLATTIFASFAGLKPSSEQTAQSHPVAVKQVMKAATRG